MTALSVTLSRRRRPRRHARRPRATPLPLLPIALASGITATALVLVVYLLWPTWTPQRAGEPGELPVSVGATLFNIPTYALRRQVQKHSGAQERVDLDFAYPSLGPAAAAPRVTAATADTAAPTVDALFLSIALGDETVSPDERRRSIYPRYLDTGDPALLDGLAVTPFRDGTPYAGEDLAIGEAPSFAARCSRDSVTPGMCMSERRVGGADLTFRFPRSWLTQWRDVADAMERLVARLHRPHG